MSKRPSAAVGGSKGKGAATLPIVGGPVIKAETNKGKTKGSAIPTHTKANQSVLVPNTADSAVVQLPPVAGALPLPQHPCTEETERLAKEASAEEQERMCKEKQEEEKRLRKQQEEEEKRLRKQQQQEEEEEERLRKERGNGSITVVYNQYHEPFPIVDGSTTASNIDEEYALSFVMPNCLIHLSLLESRDLYGHLAAGADPFVQEDPVGVYRGLVKNTTYYCFVEEQEEFKKRDQEATRRRLAAEVALAHASSGRKDDGRVLESCSCIEGNPCVDEYGCKDWGNRFAVAQKNGWKGF